MALDSAKSVSCSLARQRVILKKEFILFQRTGKALESDDVQVAREALEVSSSCPLLNVCD